MSKTTGVICVTLLALGIAFGAGPKDRDGGARNQVEGTWEHDIPGQPELRQVKVINADHFIWVTSLRATKEAVLAAGGSYTLKGDTYTEMIEIARFGTAEMQKEGVGKAQPFQIKIVGDTKTVTADLGKGRLFREVWKRVK